MLTDRLQGGVYHASYEEVEPRPHRRLLVSTHLQSVGTVEITRTDRGASADDILDGR